MFGTAPGFFGAAHAPGMWTLVEKKVGTGASGTIAFTGLDGDTDKLYHFQARFELSSFTSMGFKFNTTTPTGGNGFSGSSSSYAGSTSTLMFSGNTGLSFFASGYINADTVASLRRAMMYQGVALSSGAYNYGGGFYWTDTSTNLTQIQFVTTTGNYTTDAQVWLYRLTDPTP